MDDFSAGGGGVLKEVVGMSVIPSKLMLTEARWRDPGNRLKGPFQMEARDIERLHNLGQQYRYIPECDFCSNRLCWRWRSSSRGCHRGDHLREPRHLAGVLEAFNCSGAVHDLHADAVNDVHMASHRKHVDPPAVLRIP